MFTMHVASAVLGGTGPLVNSRTRHIDFDQLRSLSVIFLAFLNADA